MQNKLQPQSMQTYTQTPVSLLPNVRKLSETLAPLRIVYLLTYLLTYTAAYSQNENSEYKVWATLLVKWWTGTEVSLSA